MSTEVADETDPGSAVFPLLSHSPIDISFWLRSCICLLSWSSTQQKSSLSTFDVDYGGFTGLLARRGIVRTGTTCWGPHLPVSFTGQRRTYFSVSSWLVVDAVHYRQHWEPVFSLLRNRFWGFRPAGATRCTNGVKFGIKEGSSMPNFTPNGATTRV